METTPQTSLPRRSPEPIVTWQRWPGPSGGSCGAQHRHIPTGHTIIHCGHATANRSYYIKLADGRSVYNGSRQAFRSLSDAKIALCDLIAGRSPIFDETNQRWITNGIYHNSLRRNLN